MSSISTGVTTGPRPWASLSPPLRFGIEAALWVVALLALMRLRVVQAYVLVPFTQAQAEVAAWYLGMERLPVVASLECSAADVIALALGVALAYPVAWRARLAGAAGALVAIVALNIARLATLSMAVGTTAFVPLHLQVWPAILMFAVLAYLAVWIRLAEGASADRGGDARRALLRFGAWAGALVVIFQALAPWWVQSRILVRLSMVAASATAAVLAALGAEVSASGPIINATHGSYLVTPECIMTPLMPIYLAAVMAISLPTRHRLSALAAFGPLFALLGLARLLTVALPPLVGGSRFVLTHAFYQLLLGAILVGLVAYRGSRQQGPRLAARRAVGALVAGIAVVSVAGGLYTTVVVAATQRLAPLFPHPLTDLAGADPLQGAWLLLPPFQLGLAVALAVAWPVRRVGQWLAALAIIAAASVGALVAGGELVTHVAAATPTTAVRAWAVLGPVLAVVAPVWASRRSG